MILYRSDTREKPKNTNYPIRCEVTTPQELAQAVRFDTVSGEFTGGKRSNKTFVSSNCLFADLDNNHTEDPDAWKDESDIVRAFQGVGFYYWYSRNHMKEKNGKAPRPKLHIAFELAQAVTTPEQYTKLAREVLAAFPFFDEKVKDAAHFFFGVENPECHYVNGARCIDQVVTSVITPAEPAAAPPQSLDSLAQSAPFDYNETATEGGRNDLMFKFVSSLQARGLHDDAIKSLAESHNVTHCDPPLDDRELSIIIESALRYDKGNDSPEVASVKDMLKRDRNGHIKKTIDNFITILRHDARLAGRIRYNEFNRATMLYGEVPWEHLRTLREWNNTDDSSLLYLIEHDYGILDYTKTDHAIKIIAKENAYHPIREKLEDLIKKYGGESGYIRRLLPDFLGAEDNEYNYEVMRLMMLGAVKRVYEPGCKFDYCMIFRGGQGVGKSAFSRMLALNDRWFCDSLSDLGSDRAPEIIIGAWVVELPELKSLKRTDVEAQKRFLSAQDDKIRLPYERRSETYERQCIFVGTTNEREFLTDTTGNRRYWIVDVEKEKNKSRSEMFKPEAMEVFEKAWAEAVLIYKLINPPLVPSKELVMESERQQASALSDDGEAGKLEAWLSGDRCYNGFNAAGLDRVCSLLIIDQFYGGKSDKSLPRKINNMMRNMEGWRESPGPIQIDGYGKQRGFIRITKSNKYGNK